MKKKNDALFEQALRCNLGDKGEIQQDMNNKGRKIKGNIAESGRVKIKLARNKDKKVKEKVTEAGKIVNDEIKKVEKIAREKVIINKGVKFKEKTVVNIVSDEDERGIINLKEDEEKIRKRGKDVK